MNEISCEVIQDLIKGCADGTASRATVKLVLEHIKMCDECRAKYEALRGGKKARARKWFFVLHEPMETPVRYLRWSILALAALTAVICMIVNFAVDAQITWGWIVCGAMITSVVPMLTYIQSQTYRFIRAMAAFSVLAVLLLGLIQLVLHNLMGMPGVWLWRVALPLSAIWMTVFWGAIGVAMVKKLNGFYCIAMIVFLFFPAELATAGIAAAYQGGWAANWVRMAGYVVASIVLAVMGYAFDARKRDA